MEVFSRQGAGGLMVFLGIHLTGAMRIVRPFSGVLIAAGCAFLIIRERI